jgi:hypothetical protein
MKMNVNVFSVAVEGGILLQGEQHLDCCRKEWEHGTIFVPTIKLVLTSLNQSFAVV